MLRSKDLNSEIRTLELIRNKLGKETLERASLTAQILVLKVIRDMKINQVTALEADHPGILKELKEKQEKERRESQDKVKGKDKNPEEKK